MFVLKLSMPPDAESYRLWQGRKWCKQYIAEPCGTLVPLCYASPIPGHLRFANSDPQQVSDLCDGCHSCWFHAE